MKSALRGLQQNWMVVLTTKLGQEERTQETHTHIDTLLRWRKEGKKF